MTSNRPIKVLIVDNHPLVLEGIKAILETYQHIEIVGTAANAATALEIARAALPHVTLMDINMPEMNGLDAIELFKEQVPSTRLLMLSMHDSREYISTSVMYGASGYILKDVTTDEIVAAIDAVAAGGTYFSTGVSDILLQRGIQEKRARPLTTREQAVLLLLASGKSNKDVAKTLGISARTAETHRKNIKKKLGISTTAGLTRYAIEHGLIGSDT